MNFESKQNIIKSHGHQISTSKLSKRKSAERGFNIEDSGPPSPSNGPIINFGEVALGIYRSSFPRAGNFEHLESLRLRSILTLVGGDYPEENLQFMHRNGIRHFQIPILAHKDASVVIPTERIVDALCILLNPTLHPILIHCNKGKHRTGCIIACYRRLQTWPIDAALTEYRKFAGTKSRDLDEKFIRAFDVDAVLDMVQTKKMTALAMLPTPPTSEKNYWDEDEG